MPRPHLPQASRKTRNIIFRVNEADYVRLSEKATAAALTVHQFARMLTLSRKDSITFQTCEQTDPELLNQLRKIGVNLNQLSKNANIFGRVSPKVDDLCEEIADIISKAVDERAKR